MRREAEGGEKVEHRTAAKESARERGSRGLKTPAEEVGKSEIERRAKLGTPVFDSVYPRGLDGVRRGTYCKYGGVKNSAGIMTADREVSTHSTTFQNPKWIDYWLGSYRLIKRGQNHFRRGESAEEDVSSSV